MKLADWLLENRWTILGFSKHTGISRTALQRALQSRVGTITLKTAQTIEKETKGKVKIRDLFPQDLDSELKRPGKQKKKDKEKIENTEQTEIK